jgi:fructan beta-fructosidase
MKKNGLVILFSLIAILMIVAACAPSTSIIPAATPTSAPAAIQTNTSQPSSVTTTVQPSVTNEPFRPQFHFSPPTNWMNDPNGLVYLDGEYHLFYQYNPTATVWGPMHWGHAVSPDLLNWRYLPVALAPDSLGNIFSGSAVVDQNNTAGFGANAMVAIFTHEQNGAQRQSLAYSTDKGRTWTKYAGNPVLKAPGALKDFRDPKVFWYTQGGNGHWVMLVAAMNRILFYTSPDLKTWSPSGEFGPGFGSTYGVWECPELQELPLDGGPQTRWMLAVGVGSGAPNSGSGEQYFIGDFDGQAFTSANPAETVLWVDNGADFYAAQAWNGAPGGRSVWLGWMNNWAYAQNTPSSSFRGSFSLPRQLALVTTPQGIRLQQKPIAELQALRGPAWQLPAQPLPAGTLPLNGISEQTLEIMVEFALDVPSADRFGFRVKTGEGDYAAIAYAVGYDVKAHQLFVDRSGVGEMSIKPPFAGIHSANLEPDAKSTLSLHIFVDRSSVEVFANNGQIVITDQIFPASIGQTMELFSEGGQVKLKSLTIYPIQPATFTFN